VSLVNKLFLYSGVYSFRADILASFVVMSRKRNLR